MKKIILTCLIYGLLFSNAAGQQTILPGNSGDRLDALKLAQADTASTCHTDDGRQINLSLSPSCWTTLSPYGGSAAATEASGGLRVYGSGTRQGTQAYFKTALDLSRAAVYVKWRAHGPSGYYAAWGLGAGSFPGSSDTSIDGAATAGWTPKRHGAGFTTNNSWNDSKVISDDTWYYTRISTAIDQTVYAVTCTGNYDDSGGDFFYSHRYTLDDLSYSQLTNGTVFASFNDNYGGTDTWMEIGEARVTKTCSELCLDITYDGIAFTMSWNSLSQATGYTIYYAFSDYLGEADMSTFATVDVGTQTSFSASLPSGTAIYLAIVASTPGGDVISNIEMLSPFGGTVTQPETGATLLEISDLGGVGNIQVIGTETNQAPGLPVKQIRYENNAEGYTCYFDEDEIAALDLTGKTGIFLEQDQSGQWTYAYKVNGTTRYSGTIATTTSETLAAKTTKYADTGAGAGADGFETLLRMTMLWETLNQEDTSSDPQPCADESICNYTREGYQEYLEKEDPDVMALKKGYGAIAVNLLMPAISRVLLSETSDSLEFFIWILEDMLRETAKSILEIQAEKLACFDSLCQDDDDNDDDTTSCVLSDTRYSFKASWTNDKYDSESTTSFSCSLKADGTATCSSYDCTWQMRGSTFELECKSSIYTYHIIYTSNNISETDCAISGTMQRIDASYVHGTFEATRIE